MRHDQVDVYSLLSPGDLGQKKERLHGVSLLLYR